MAGSARAPGTGDAAAEGGVFGTKSLGWAVFEFARNPYYNLVVIYVFAPYFASVVAGGGARGQAWAGASITIAGVVCALSVPLLGAAADRGCRVKPVIAAFIILLGLVSCALWFVTPGLGAAGIALGVALSVLGYCSYTYSEVLHNAILAQAARPSALPLVSGLAIGLGNLAAVTMFIIMLAGFILPVRMPGLAGLPDGPLFGLDPEKYEHLRIVGPLVAAWMAVFIQPFFLFMPERRPIRSTWPQALGWIVFGPPDGTSRPRRFARQLRGLFAYARALARDCPDAMRFLLARLIYADGMAALLTLGGVYAGGFLGWGEVELVILAITGSVFAAIGALAGGVLDRAVGPRRALMVEIGLLILLFVFSLSITKQAILFGLLPADRPVHGGTIMPTLADLAYLGAIMPMAVLVGAIITSSRVMLVQLAPPERVGEFFGLFSIAGTITVWIGPGLVTLITVVSGNQRAGMTGIAVLFAAGLALLLTIRKGARARAATPPGG